MSVLNRCFTWQVTIMYFFLGIQDATLFKAHNRLWIKNKKNDLPNIFLNVCYQRKYLHERITIHVYLLTIHVHITCYTTVSFIDHFIINGANQAPILSVRVLPCDGVCCITCSTLNVFFSLSSYHRRRPQLFLRPHCVALCQTQL
jgi:hypothetical protein